MDNFLQKDGIRKFFRIFAAYYVQILVILIRKTI